MHRAAKMLILSWVACDLTTALAVGNLSVFSQPAEVPNTTPRGLATLLVAHANGERKPILGETAGPGPDRRLELFVQADIPCFVVIAAFDRRTQGLWRNWRPMLAKLETGQPLHLPPKDMAWPWDQDASGFEMWVAFFPADQIERSPVVKIARALADGGGDPYTQRLQGRRLWIEWSQLQQGSKIQDLMEPGRVPNTTGAVTRGIGFEWRAHAKPVALDPKAPSCLRFSLPPASRSR